MTSVSVKNWDKWQTFRKDRGAPPWIKLHRNLMSNPEWALLSDSEKGQLVSIWIVAADKSGLIPSNPNIIRKVCLLDETPNINRFIELGFLSTTCQPLASQESDETPQLDPPEESREEKKRVEQKGFKPPTHIELQEYCKEKNYTIDADRFINFYESKGWMVGKNKMKSWKAAASNWAKPSQDDNQQNRPVMKELSNG